MIRQLDIDSFRGFSKLGIHELGQVNLLVGRNNCGKTSVLEAIHMLVATGDPSSIWHIAHGRGEYVPTERQPPARGPEIDISQLFHGHELGPDSRFAIADDSKRKLVATIESAEEPGPQPSPSPLPSPSPEPYRSDETLGDTEGDFEAPARFRLAWSRQGLLEARWEAPLTPRGSIHRGRTARQWDELRGKWSGDHDGQPVRVVSTAGLTPEQVTSLFEDVMLTPEEHRAVDAIRTIDPGIERIAPKSGRSYSAERGGMFVKRAGLDRPVPIGTMGDGIWRMLGLALALAKSSGGVLLVDEIDTGLHYTVMDKMWTLVTETAHRLNVQVFATSHSRDCFESLAFVSPSAAERGIDVSVQRLEQGASEAVAFTKDEIFMAAERAVEVR